jgi:large subunit ribosomal protein L35
LRSPAFPHKFLLIKPPGAFRACRGGFSTLLTKANLLFARQGAGTDLLKGSKMPKMKTKSGAKKRFKITGTGKVIAAQAGKRHGMIKRTKKFIRQARGTNVLCDADAGIVKQFLPYGK